MRSVQFSSVAQLCLTLCDPHRLQHARPPCPSPTPRTCSNSCPSSRWCHPTTSSSYRPLLLLPSIFPSLSVISNDQLFASSSQSIGTSGLIDSGLISFKIDWFDLLAVQGTLKSLLQCHSWKASILWCSVFFMVQLSHPYVTTGKTVALTIWTFVSKVMPLLFNMLSRLVIACLPRK